MMTIKTVLGSMLALVALLFGLLSPAAHAGGLGSGAGAGARAVVAQKTPVSSKDGGAAVRADITWDSARSAEVKGTYDDLCPRDVDKAYLTVRANTSEGSVVKRFVDSAPCSAAAKGFKVDLSAVTQRAIHSIRIDICEAPKLRFSKALCVIKKYDNPRD